jgi:hypothetical protein
LANGIKDAINEALSKMNPLKWFASGGIIPAMSAGGVVEGQAVKAGDSLANDTIPVMLSPGEMVIPRSFMTEGLSGVIRFASTVLGESPMSVFQQDPSFLKSFIGGMLNENVAPERSETSFNNRSSGGSEDDKTVNNTFNVTLNVKTDKLDEREIKSRIIPAIKEALLSDSKRGRRIIDPLGARI